MDTITSSQLLELFYEPLGIPPRRWVDRKCLDDLAALRRWEPNSSALLKLRTSLNWAILKGDDEQIIEFVNLYVSDSPKAKRREIACLILVALFGYIFRD